MQTITPQRQLNTAKTDIPKENRVVNFRGDIEGLRALAILLVVAVHADIPGFKGGFIGVDVFFVLSGYLITSLLFQEVQATGGVQLLGFYARRLKRLLPALLFMLVCVCVLAAIILAPFEQSIQASTASMASIWMSNLYFVFSELDYFGGSASSNLFLHTWSLGVEEQFYLIWPILVILLLGAFRWQGGKKNVSRLQLGMVVVAIICLLLSIALTSIRPDWAFYLMPSRAWQFAMGACTALWFDKINAKLNIIVNHNMRVWLGWIGMVLILAAAMLLDEKISYPGMWAIIPSVGAALILFAGTTGDLKGVTKLLSNPILQKIGGVSYSWYLWHWPILILGSTLVVFDQLVNRLVLVVISLGLAAFSFWAVESPIRRSRLLASKPIFVLGISVLVMFGAFAVSINWKNYSISWSLLPEQNYYKQVRSNFSAIYSMGCDDWFHSESVHACEFGDDNAVNAAVVIGDSIMAQWFPAIEPIYTKPGWRLIVLTKSACPMVDESFFYTYIGMEYTVCDNWRNDALTLIESLHPDVTFIGDSSHYAFSQEQWTSGTKRVLDRVTPVSKIVFVMQPTYNLPFDGLTCLARRDWRPAFLSLETACSAPAGSEHQRNVQLWLSQAAKGYDNVFVLNMNPFVCPNDRCYAEYNGKIIFRDSGHLATNYVVTLADLLAEQINEKIR